MVNFGLSGYLLKEWICWCIGWKPPCTFRELVDWWLDDCNPDGENGENWFWLRRRFPANGNSEKVVKNWIKIHSQAEKCEWDIDGRSPRAVMTKIRTWYDLKNFLISSVWAFWPASLPEGKKSTVAPLYFCQNIENYWMETWCGFFSWYLHRKMISIFTVIQNNFHFSTTLSYKDFYERNKLSDGSFERIPQVELKIGSSSLHVSSKSRS